MRRALAAIIVLTICRPGDTAGYGVSAEVSKRPGEWVCVSETSAVVCWQTDVPSRSYVEYGETVAYGKKTPLSDVSKLTGKPYWTQFHRITGLRPALTYHYRTVSIATDGKKLTGEPGTFTTKKYVGAIRIPDDFTAVPYTLDEPGKTYVLTRDIRTQGAAIQIIASDITLDLDGHTVLYDQTDGVASGAYVRGVPPTRGVGHGVIMDLANANKSMDNVRIRNGVIRQGNGGGEGNNAGWGHNPFLTTGPARLELAGITAVYSGASISGLLIRKPREGCNIHHNVVEDLGTKIKNRHLGLDAISAQTDKEDPAPDSLMVHHNLIKRCRHRGIRGGGGSNVHHNEMYIDSYATNSYGIMFYGGKVRNVQAANNRIFGAGYHPVAIGVGWVTNAKIDSNHIELVAGKPSSRSTEYGDMSTVSGIRVWGGSNIDVSRNTLDIRNAGGRGSRLRGFWSYWKNTGPSGLVFRENTVKVIVTPDATDRAFCVVAGDGSKSGPQTPPVLYRNNTFISNICNVTLGDGYCPRSFNKHFIGNRFVKVGSDPRYCTIRCGATGYPVSGCKFLDSTFEGGAGYDRVKYRGGGQREFSVGWTLTLEVAPGGKVAIKDKTGKEVFRGTLPREGKLEVPLLEYVQKRDARTALTPHTVTVESAGATAKRTVTMDRKRTYRITGTTWKETR